MKILITGGLGNVGIGVVGEAIRRNHSVKVLYNKLDKVSRKRMKSIKGKVDFVKGDICNLEQMILAVKGADAVVHLAAIVPPISEENYIKTYVANVGGLQNIITAIKLDTNKATLIFSSSTSVLGPTQHKTPPIKLEDKPNPINNYTKTKVEAENLLASCDVDYCIMRLASVMTEAAGYTSNSLRLLFDFPLHARNEIVHVEDVACAMMNAIDRFDLVNKQTFFIGGGKALKCQIHNRDMIKGMFEAMGIGMIDERAFIKSVDMHYMDWYDTSRSQSILEYQNHSFDDYLEALEMRTAKSRFMMKLMAKSMRKSFERMSPYYRR